MSRKVRSNAREPTMAPIRASATATHHPATTRKCRMGEAYCAVVVLARTLTPTLPSLRICRAAFVYGDSCANRFSMSSMLASPAVVSTGWHRQREWRQDELTKWSGQEVCRAFTPFRSFLAPYQVKDALVFPIVGLSVAGVTLVLGVTAWSRCLEHAWRPVARPIGHWGRRWSRSRVWTSRRTLVRSRDAAGKAFASCAAEAR
jgi:hypothetical protein